MVGGRESGRGVWPWMTRIHKTLSVGKRIRESEFVFVSVTAVSVSLSVSVSVLVSVFCFVLLIFSSFRHFELG